MTSLPKNGQKFELRQRVFALRIDIASYYLGGYHIVMATIEISSIFFLFNPLLSRSLTSHRRCEWRMMSLICPCKPGQCGATAERRPRDREVPVSKLACAIWFFLGRGNLSAPLRGSFRWQCSLGQAITTVRPWGAPIPLE